MDSLRDDKRSFLLGELARDLDRFSEDEVERFSRSLTILREDIEGIGLAETHPLPRVVLTSLPFDCVSYPRLVSSISPDA